MTSGRVLRHPGTEDGMLRLLKQPKLSEPAVDHRLQQRAVDMIRAEFGPNVVEIDEAVLEEAKSHHPSTAASSF